MSTAVPEANDGATVRTMPENVHEVRAVAWRSVLPWLHLLRGFRLAADIRKIALGAVGLVVFAAGNMLIERLPFAPPDRPAASGPWDDHPVSEPAAPDRGPLSAARAAFVALGGPSVVRPWTDMADPGARLLRAAPTWSDLAFDVTRGLWALVVWSIAGGAIARMTALQFARNEKIAVSTALRFSLRRGLSLTCAPLLPLAGLAVLRGLCILAGWTALVPVVGEPVVGAAWGLFVAIGLLMGLIVLGTAAGWPLMVAGIAVEGSDAFDGFSRAFGFVTGRVRYCAGLIATSLLLGTIGAALVRAVAGAGISLAAWGVAGGSGTDRMQQLLLGAPESFAGTAAWLGPLPSSVAAGESVAPGAYLVSGWLHVIDLLVLGFGASWFWSAATISYFLIRRAEDAVDFGEVYLSDDEQRDDLLPLVGVAASDQPVIERPIAPIPKEEAGAMREGAASDASASRSSPDSSDAPPAS